ncbi:MAG TPA: hypothetical protein DEA26_02445 [Oceanospirillales bacterium]|nr:hypothetical protein [Oceanospirillaceae bacterium]HBS41513.1 hypothetical protein [Oceanospirillales bacterium]|tara:strand:+ start:2780 stop:3922 length:1143 start_codon:yes stop_codon:yes gene_type:complete
MSSVLLLAVNRHQETYFRKIAAAATSLNIRILHDNRLPLIFGSWKISDYERQVLEEIVQLRLDTLAQESPGYRLSYFRRKRLTLQYRLSVWWFYLRARSYFGQNCFDLVGLWSGMKWRQRIIRQLLLPAETRTLFFENGAFPDTTTVDPEGVNFGSSIPDDPVFFLSHKPLKKKELPHRLSVRKASHSRKTEGNQLLPAEFCFVPFQVDSDTQILEYSPDIQNMEQLYKLLCDTADLSDGRLPVFVVKEHPSSKNDYRHLHNRHPGVVFCNQEETQRLIETARCVVTINSSVGFEALLLNKPVITLGKSFYALDGLVTSVQSAADLVTACQNPQPADPSLRDAFLQYLYSEYYVHGCWRTASDEHTAAVVQRMERILKNA